VDVVTTFGDLRGGERLAMNGGNSRLASVVRHAIPVDVDATGCAHPGSSKMLIIWDHKHAVAQYWHAAVRVTVLHEQPAKMADC